MDDETYKYILKNKEEKVYLSSLIYQAKISKKNPITTKKSGAKTEKPIKISKNESQIKADSMGLDLRVKHYNKKKPSQMKLDILESRESEVKLIDNPIDEKYMVQSEEVSNILRPILKKCQVWQKRLKETYPMKFKTKKRYVQGFNEVMRDLELRKIKAVIIACDVEYVDGDSGTIALVKRMLDMIADQNLYLIHALGITRRKLGKFINCFQRVSVLGLWDISNIEPDIRQLHEFCQRINIDGKPSHLELITREDDELSLIKQLDKEIEEDK